MAEYIKRSDAVFAACKVLDKFGGCKMGPRCPDVGCSEVRDVFDEIPAADVRPVVHGKWIKVKYPLYECSVCGAVYQDVGYGFNFCPNCGARMDGDS